VPTAQAPALLEAYRALLSPEELASAAAGGPAAAGVLQERLLSKALVRITLARYAGVPPAVRAPATSAHATSMLAYMRPRRCLQALRFGRNAHGKPWLSPPLGAALASPLCFSVAHAPGALLCAVAAGADVGCDVEPGARGSAAVASRLARRYFTPAEAASLEALPPGEPRRRRFIQLWTLKEAYVKALGRGIAAAPLNSFALRLLAGDADADAAAHDVAMRVALAHAAAPHAVAHRGDGESSECADAATADGDAPLGGLLLGAARVQPAAWRFALLELRAGGGAAGDGHVAAVCVGAACKDAPPLALRCWRTLPLAWDAPAAAHELLVLAESSAA
jgi:4'-phosphopantetheinyl transferase